MHCESKVSCPRTQHNVAGQGSNPETSILIMRPPPFKACCRKIIRNDTCLLRGFSDLTYYTPETYYSSCELNINTVNVLLTENRNQTAEYTFLLRTRKGIKYIFRAASEEDRMDWVQTLQTVCENT